MLFGEPEVPYSEYHPYSRQIAALKWHWMKVQQLGVERDLLLRELRERAPTLIPYDIVCVEF